MPGGRVREYRGRGILEFSGGEDEEKNEIFYEINADRKK